MYNTETLLDIAVKLEVQNNNNNNNYYWSFDIPLNK